MKKIMSVLLVAMAIALFAAGCSSGAAQKNDERTLADFTQAYVDAGIELERQDTPLFSLIEAVDGTLFYTDDGIVKVYEYKSAKALEDARKEFDLIADWPSNGKFLLETKNEKAIEIFNNVE